MKTYKLEQFTNGWVVGNFPSLFQNQHVEVAVHYLDKDHVHVPHIHKVATEINIITQGSLLVNGIELCQGDLWVYEPSDISNVVVLLPATLVVIKYPSIPGDKYVV